MRSRNVGSGPKKPYKRTADLGIQMASAGGSSPSLAAAGAGLLTAAGRENTCAVLERLLARKDDRAAKSRPDSPESLAVRYRRAHLHAAREEPAGKPHRDPTSARRERNLRVTLRRSGFIGRTAGFL